MNLNRTLRFHILGRCSLQKSKCKSRENQGVVKVSTGVEKKSKLQQNDNPTGVAKTFRRVANKLQEVVNKLQVIDIINKEKR